LKLAEAPEPIPVPNIAGITKFADGTPRATTPVLGQHTADILRDHGFKPAEIAALIERKVVAAAKV
jgi:crotonobetainyl-CoA:carnitine CoA-transferase CaiB-like acyl-CoA transferase